MKVTPVNGQLQANATSNLNEETKKTQAKAPQVDAKYEEKAPAPSNADMYKAMYGVKEEKSFAEQMAEFRAKYELDVDDKNREIEANRRKQESGETQEKEEKSFYEQYLEYKHKYE